MIINIIAAILLLRSLSIHYKKQTLSKHAFCLLGMLTILNIGIVGFYLVAGEF